MIEPDIFADVFAYLIPSHTCVVSFSSGAPTDFGEGYPIFEFGNSLAAMGLAYVLIRDLDKFDCNFGIRSLGDRNAVAAFVRNLMDRYPRVVCIGLSVGSYNALMYGQLAGVDEIIALSPYSHLGGLTYDPDLVKIFNPEEMRPDWRERTPFPIEPLVDLAPIFANGPTPRTRAFIGDGDHTQYDRPMAERINIRDITIVSGGVSHPHLGRVMRDRGMLKELLARGRRR